MTGEVTASRQSSEEWLPSLVLAGHGLILGLLGFIVACLQWGDSIDRTQALVGFAMIIFGVCQVACAIGMLERSRVAWYAGVVFFLTDAVLILRYTPMPFLSLVSGSAFVLGSCVLLWDTGLRRLLR